MIKEDLRCPKCISDELGFGQSTCPKGLHGDKYIDYKCRFCCNIALYVCFAGTHMCDSCHKKACKQTLNFYRNESDIKCSNPHGKCPLGIRDHVQAWKTPSFSLGCSLCRSEKLHFMHNEIVVHQKDRNATLTNIKQGKDGEFEPRLWRKD